MKTKLNLVLAALLCCAGYSLNAQTNSAPLPPIDSTLSLSSGTQAEAITNHAGVWADLKQLGGDAWDALKGLDFANGIRSEPFGIIHDSDWGGGLAITTAKTNGINAGFAVAAITAKHTNKKTGKVERDFDFYDATLSLQLGQPFTLFNRLHGYAYVEFGPALNLAHPDTILEQSVAGVKFFLLKGRADVGAGVLQNSEWSTPAMVLHASYTW